MLLWMEKQPSDILEKINNKEIKSYVDEWDPDAFLIGCPSKPSEDFFRQLNIFKENLKNEFNYTPSVKIIEGLKMFKKYAKREF